MYAINLKTEHLKNPLGIDKKRPYLTWNCEDGKRQTAYEIQAYCDDKPVWCSGRVEGSHMHAFYEGKLSSRQRIYWKIRLWDETDTVGEWSEMQWFEMGLLSASDFKAKWINPEPECDPAVHKPASYLKTSFFVKKEALQKKSARLYVTCHGLYEAFINKKRVGNFVLAPGSYNYDVRLAYQTYDVSDLLVEGENDVEVILGDGWYRSVSGVDGDRNLYGEDVALYFQLEINGEAVCISDEHWLASQDGPIRENDMQQGEVVDARMEEIQSYHEVKTEDFGTEKLICSNCVPVCEKERFTGKLFKTPNGETVIDFGQNMAGYVSFSLCAKAGQSLVLSHGEALDENGNFTQENFQDRQRHKEGGTKQRVVYTCKDGQNEYHTKFSIWGFRYAKVETEIDLSEASFTAIAVYSDMETLGTFQCSDERVNRLVENSIWSQKSNFCDVPTDCPTRERAAWTGDMGVFIGAGLTLMDCYPVVRKWLAECRNAQYADGRIANIAPRNSNPSFFSGLLAGSVGWGDAVIIVPYEMYCRYGDIRILEENYDMMKKWYAYLEKRAAKKSFSLKRLWDKNPYRSYTIEKGIDYGEWCEPDVESTSAMRTPQPKVATAYLASSGKTLSRIAKLLGNDEDAAHFAEVGEYATKAYRRIATENGRITSDRQAEYVRAIAFALLDEKETRQAAADLNTLVTANGYHLNTGFLSTPHLCRVLADYGYEDSAYRLLLQEDMPSWLYEVSKGATSIWENWDGINEEGYVKASLNHYSYGAICGWLFDGVCGIQIKDGEIVICPHPNKALSFARASYLSPLGRITSAWELREKVCRFEVEIPANVTAVLLLPSGEKRTLPAGKTETEIIL